MAFSLFKKLFGFGDPIKKYRAVVAQINALEPEIEKLSNDELKNKSLELKKLVQENQKTLDEILPEAFALIRESAKRNLKQRHFDVQLIGGMVLHQGKIAEMATGEGKTLTATLAAYLNALSGKGMHIMTVNDYLAKRDAVWMGQIYHALGLIVGCLAHEASYIYDPSYVYSRTESEQAQNNTENSSAKSALSQRESALLDVERDTTGSYLVQMDYLRPVSRKEAYLADITYGTNHEFGFDYLRDNLVYDLNSVVQVRRQTQNNSASFSVESASFRDGKIHNFVIVDEVDSILIDEARTPLIISAPDTESSQYYKIFSRIVVMLEPNTDYIVEEKHRAVDLTQEGIDKIEKALKIKNLFDPENLRLVHYLQESLRAHALYKRDKEYVVKNGEIIIVDEFTGRLMYGRRYSGGLHQAIEAKEGLHVNNESRTYAQISIQNYVKLYKKIAGMTGTAQTSAEEFDKVYEIDVVTIPTNQPMIRKDLPDKIYKTLDAKLDAVAQEIKKKYQKGQPVLVGTVSIEKNEKLSRLLKLNGVPHQLLNAKNHEKEGAVIAQAGKLKAVTVATNMAGRGVDIILGGNPQDQLEAQKVRELGGLHVIGTERHESRRIDNQLRGRSGRQGDPGSSQFFLSLEDDLLRIFGGDKMKRMMDTLNVPEDMPIESKLISKIISDAQSKVEGMNFDARKHLLEYDTVLNQHRQKFYAMRQKMLEQNEQPLILAAFDQFWMNHLENMESLAESVRLRAYGQKDPLVEYKHEGHFLFQQLLENYNNWLKENKDELEKARKSADNMQTNAEIPRDSTLSPRKSAHNFTGGKIGRNDPCPCGSGKKYKKCHGQ